MVIYPGEDRRRAVHRFQQLSIFEEIGEKKKAAVTEIAAFCANCLLSYIGQSRISATGMLKNDKMHKNNILNKYALPTGSADLVRQKL